LRWSTIWIVALLVCSACKVGSEDIEYWKGTVKGPGKIVAVMLADKYPVELRTQAALALVDMERPDRDGTSDLQQALARLDEEERNALISGMVPGLVALMRQSDPAASGATPRQIRAKDAAFLLVTHAPAAVKTQLTADVVSWYMEDFNGRNLAGNYSAEQVIRALGQPAGKELVKGLKARLPPAALVKLSQLIGQVADPQSKREAAAKVVAIHKEMESDAFLAYLKQTIKEQAERGGQKVDAKRLDAIAVTNRNNYINDGAIPAMKWLADEPPVKKRLFEIASNDDLDAERRARALQALEGKVGPGDLSAVMRIALARNSPDQVRDYAFDRVGDIRSPEALKELWPLLSSTENAKLRWRVGELVLGIGGGSVVSTFFEKLPPADYPARELDGYATRLGQMTPVPMDAVRKQLTSKDWYAQVIAIRFFERKGSGEDVKQIEALKGEATPVKGEDWGKTKTVGEVAAEAVTGAKQRLGQP
jgi:HEAT repeat protein